MQHRLEVYEVLHLLLKSYQYAKDLGVDVWNFSVELPELEKTKVTRTELRWLIEAGYAAHSHEIKDFGGEERCFRCLGKLLLNQDSCFVLTDAGSQYTLEQMAQLENQNKTDPIQASDPGQNESVEHPENEPPGGNGKESPANGKQSNGKPIWDAENRVLRLSDQTVKKFRRPAPIQEAILAAFQEENWPTRIDDPIPPCCNQDRKQCLRGAIRSLNQHQEDGLIQFFSDGEGGGICWQAHSRIRVCSCRQ